MVSWKFLWDDYTKAVADEDMLFSLLSSEFEDVFENGQREDASFQIFRRKKVGKLKAILLFLKRRGQFLTALMGAAGR